jgi:predicted amino acid racemase
MAFLTLDRKKLRKNYDFLTEMFEGEEIDWGVVTKLLCGNRAYLEEIIRLGVRELHDTRISNLKVIKSIDPDIQTVYIKPPAKRSIPNVIRYADVSFNTEYPTMKLLSEEAKKQDKIHKVIIMIEMGDLREGVMGDDLLQFYEQVFDLSNIEVIGLGTNLNCLSGVMPSHDKLIQLSLYEQLIEAKFNRKIPWVSAGTSVTIPLLFKKQLPKGVNHFRVGETLYYGNDLFTDLPIAVMEDDVIRLHTEIIELNEKPKVPIGEIASNPSGVAAEVKEEDFGKTSYRAILDVGLLDINPKFLIPIDKRVEIAEASSDMLVVDLGQSNQNYKVGDIISFKPKYMGTLSLMSSDYIAKRFASDFPKLTGYIS